METPGELNEHLNNANLFSFADLPQERQAALWMVLVYPEYATAKQKESVYDPGWMVFDQRLKYYTRYGDLYGNNNFDVKENPFLLPLEFSSERVSVASILGFENDDPENGKVESVANVIITPRSHFGANERVLMVEKSTGKITTGSPYGSYDYVVHGGWMYAHGKKHKRSKIAALPKALEIAKSMIPGDSRVAFVSYPAGHYGGMSNLMEIARYEDIEVAGNHLNHPDKMKHSGMPIDEIVKLSPEKRVRPESKFTYSLMVRLGAMLVKDDPDIAFLQPYSAGPVIFVPDMRQMSL